MSSNRTLIAIVGGVIGLVALAIVVVLLADRGAAPNFSPGSAQRAMQDYLAAWDEGDLETTYGFLSQRVRDRHPQEAYEQAAGDYRTHGQPAEGSRRVLIDDVTGGGDRVTMQLTIEELVGDGLGTTVYRSTREIRMVREDGAWRIDEPLVWLETGYLYEQP